jgi:hypothetical protein
MKRLRHKHRGEKIRFFHCGEYGETLGRPHYHAIIFGYDFRNKDSYIIGEGSNYQIKGSEELEELWPFGFHAIGDVNFESAAYVARYIVKKITGEKALEHYCDIDKETGEILRERKPEYTTMSRRPGIASDWIKKYHTDVYPSDEVIVRGKEVKPPRYYDRQYELINEEAMKKVRGRRMNISEKIRKQFR